jgi:adenine/guanine phosphoribosyltransferase-like PRPP-binding protein
VLKEMSKFFSPSESGRNKYIGSSHTTGFIHPYSLDKFVKNAIKIMKSKRFQKIYPEYDTLAFSGYSGALIAPILALALGKELVLVRKPTDVRASGYDVEGYEDVKKYIIVDDFVYTGETAERIYKSIKKFAPDAKCLGVLSVQKLQLGNRNTLQTPSIRVSGEWVAIDKA